MLACLKCDKDVTIAYQIAPPHRLFRCECGSQDFIERADDPLKKWELTANDRFFLLE